ncbi:MAG: hypothetical protein BWX93_01494 [Bacteroidetes bacterium ADurb.Bin139]|nr:MAG: hypothetical protein BWX93_01494 [Bacteroidetes bacterium ADurb.Bin139]
MNSDKVKNLFLTTKHNNINYYVHFEVNPLPF